MSPLSPVRASHVQQVTGLASPCVAEASPSWRAVRCMHRDIAPLASPCVAEASPSWRARALHAHSHRLGEPVRRRGVAQTTQRTSPTPPPHHLHTAQKMMEKMSPEELVASSKMAQEQMAKMSPEEMASAAQTMAASKPQVSRRCWRQARDT